MSQQGLSAISFLSGPTFPKEMLWQFSLKVPRGWVRLPAAPGREGGGTASRPRAAASQARGTARQLRWQACPLEASQLHRFSQSGTTAPTPLFWMAQGRDMHSSYEHRAAPTGPGQLSGPSYQKEGLLDVNSGLLSWAFKLKCTCFILVLTDQDPSVLQSY